MRTQFWIDLSFSLICMANEADRSRMSFNMKLQSSSLLVVLSIDCRWYFLCGSMITRFVWEHLMDGSIFRITGKSLKIIGKKENCEFTKKKKWRKSLGATKAETYSKHKTVETPLSLFMLQRILHQPELTS